MGEVRKQSIRNILISYVGTVIGAINTILLFPNLLDPEVVGLSSVLVNASLIYAQLAALGSGNIIIRFFPFFKTQYKDNNGFATISALLTTVGFILITIIYLLFKSRVIDFYIDQSPLFTEYFYALIILSYFTMLFNIGEAWSRSVFLTVFPSFLKDVFLRALITISVSLYALNWINVDQFIMLFIAANSVMGLITLFYLFKSGKLSFSKKVSIPEGLTFRSLIKYGFFSLISGISDVFVRIIDTLMLASMTGLADVGYYTRGFYLATMLQIHARAIYKIALPVVSNYWKDNDMEGMNDFYKKVSLNNLVIGVFLFAVIWVNIDEIFSLMPADYSKGKYVFLLIGLARLFDLATGINYSIILNSDRYKVDTLFTVLLGLLTVVLNIVLIKKYGMIGAAISTMCAIFTINFLRLSYVWFKFRLQPFVWEMLVVFALGGICLLVGSLIPRLGGSSWLFTVINIMISSAVISLLYLIPAYKLKLSIQLVNFIDSVIYKRDDK